MKKIDFYNRFELDLGIVEKAMHNPFYHLVQSELSDEIIIEGEHFIDLASNNYLGIANHPQLKLACIKAIEKYGSSLCATPVCSGYSDLHHRVEQKISDFTGTEQTLIYPSCYQANLGLFNAIANPEDIVFVDRCAHSSLLEGIKNSGCKISPFRHNNMDYLEMLLQKSGKYRTSFVVTESVFSTEGTIASFKEINDLCLKYDAIPVVDDSHGIGVLGASGRGILEHSGISDYQGIYTASLGKALANIGGVICGKASLMKWMQYYSPSLVYSTVILPSALAGVETVLDIIRVEFPELSKRMWNVKRRIEAALISAGFDLTNGKAPITSVKSGNSLETIQLSKSFWDKHIMTTAFVYPSVPQNEERIRLIAAANMREEIIQRAEETILQMKHP
ncbi:MAG: aminotransferase class I/II-fold pyridoxal phosphate-dependent enzyme [Bacteroidota bacterium]|nr:aminotransferase [Odoribacter sp.]MDP3643329.1 aminotransferase class I/II-fold pyridoxal phosphate-dependent enzyme [Bacteroidota bacterium]